MTSRSAVRIVGEPDPRRRSSLPAGELSGPAVRPVVLGSRMQHLRERASVSLRVAAAHAGVRLAVVAHLEQGRGAVDPGVVAALLARYEPIDDADRDALLTLARQTGEPGWWRRYGDVLPSWSEDYIGFEQAAVRIRSYDLQLVPALLQTPAMTRLVSRRGGARAAGAGLDRSIELRMQRQRLLVGSVRTSMWAVIDEAVLWRTWNEPVVVAEQIDHLLLMAQRPNVDLQVLPLTVDGYLPPAFSFTVLGFGCGSTGSDVVYLEQLNSALYVDEPAEVAEYVAAIETLRARALSPPETRALLARRRDEMLAGSGCAEVDELVARSSLGAPVMHGLTGRAEEREVIEVLRRARGSGPGADED